MTEKAAAPSANGKSGATAKPIDAGAQNEGEGSQSGARQYDEATRKFVADGKVKKAVDEAARDVSGPDADALKRAEAEGKKHSHGEDPLLRK